MQRVNLACEIDPLSESCAYSKSQCNATFRTTSFESALAGQISMPEMFTAHISAHAFWRFRRDCNLRRDRLLCMA